MIGVLALQGDFEAHARMLQRLGAHTREVRVAGDLDGLDGLVIPGGESTTMTLGIEREGLAEPLRMLAGAGSGDGIPILGSCAGLIMLDRDHLALMDIRAERNAFGRQTKSFEADVEVSGVPGPPIRGIFIRAPWIAEHGPQVEIIAEVEGHPVAARQGRMLVVSFHAELGADGRLHQMFLESVKQEAPAQGPPAGGTPS